jgi:NADP-dependent 3-hydroxy-3-methylglutaryl-CoA reductase
VTAPAVTPGRHAGRARADLDDALKVPARGRYDEAARQERLAWLRDRTGAPLDALGPMRLAADRLSGNVENAIGAVEIPVGVAGPLLFRGGAARGVVYAPLATTEGALVASASRGASALTAAGGVVTRVTAQRMTRAPAFEFAARGEALAFAAWIARQLPALRARVRAVSAHARLTGVEPVVAGSVVHVLFAYTTGDAAGQNMTTATTWHAARWVLDALPALGLTPRRFLIEGNLSSDKKVNLAALCGAGRGYAVRAGCRVSDRALRRWLKVGADELLAAHAIVLGGSERARMVGHNVNVANVVAGVFAATGQDVASVHESALGELSIEPAPGGVRARLVLPGLVLGTVGGGTHLPAQRALLEMMGCAGDGGGRRLAEVVAGFCLALDLSTLAAVATGEFAAAHERLGRNRPLPPLDTGGLGPAFFAPGLRRALASPALAVDRVETLDAGPGAGIVGELAARRTGRAVGVLHRRLHHAGGPTDVVVKLKPTDAEVRLAMQTAAAACGPRVGGAFARHHAALGFSGCHLRELAVYAQTDPRFTAHAPRVYDVVRDDARATYALVLERLGPGVRLLDSADDPAGWGAREVEAAMCGLGALHAIWLGREAELGRRPWIGVPPTAARMAEARPLWDALADHAAEAFPALMGAPELRRHRALVAALPDWWAQVEAMPRTLAHNDCNPRNVALRDPAPGDAGRPPTLCAYDWELATVHLPQRDAAELLAFVLSPAAGRAEVLHHVERHRRATAEAGAPVPNAAAWRAGFALALRDLLVHRFALYLMGHGVRHYAFLERALGTLRHLIDLELETP